MIVFPRLAQQKAFAALHVLSQISSIQASISVAKDNGRTAPEYPGYEITESELHELHYQAGWVARCLLGLEEDETLDEALGQAVSALSVAITDIEDRHPGETHWFLRQANDLLPVEKDFSPCA